MRLASVPEIANDGKQWANLCVEHDAEMNQSIVAGDVRKLLSDWVKARRGAKKAATCMMGL
jgi:hypothetical protein